MHATHTGVASAPQVSKREAVQARYDKLVERERKYFSLVRDYRAEATRNEELAT